MLSEQIRLSRELMGINEASTAAVPKFNISDGKVVLGNNKTYELETEKMWVRIGIDIVSIDAHEDGTGTLIATHPIKNTDIESKIRHSNFQKVINGMDKGEKEIMIKNLEGKEFYLVRV